MVNIIGFIIKWVFIIFLKVLKFAVKKIIKLIYETVREIKNTNFKIQFGSIISKIIYIASIACIIVPCLVFEFYWGIIYAPFFYFTIKYILSDIKMNIFIKMHNKFSKMFDNKAVVLDKKKDEKTGNETYAINMFLPLTINDIHKMKEKIEMYFNTNILHIRQHDHNKRLVFIVTNKHNDMVDDSNIENKLISILIKYGFNPKFVSKKDTDFSTMVKLAIDTNIKDIRNKMSDISFKLNKDTNVLLENKMFIFDIQKNDVPIYDFEEHLCKTKKRDGLSCVVGINHSNGSIVRLNLAKSLHTFINGKSGSGKSCIFNAIIQSLQYFHSKDIAMVMADFKGNEFKQYEHFKNVVFTNNLEEFHDMLKDIQKEITKRCETFGRIKNIEEYNLAGNNMPYIIIAIDECSFISTHKNSKEIWGVLTDIIQRGRACGIIILAATQCPDHTQINTSFRRQFDTKIVGRLRTNKDAEIAGITTSANIEKFKIGEFIIDGVEHENTKVQGFYINEKDGKNHVYDELESVLSNTRCVRLTKITDDSKKHYIRSVANEK